MGHTHHKVAGAAPAVSSVGAKYVEPSVTRILQKGEKINDLFNRNVTTPYFVQRLSERAYFFNGGFYTTTFYVGIDLTPQATKNLNISAAISHFRSVCTSWPNFKEDLHELNIVPSKR